MKLFVATLILFCLSVQAEELTPHGVCSTYIAFRDATHPSAAGTNLPAGDDYPLVIDPKSKDPQKQIATIRITFDGKVIILQAKVDFTPAGGFTLASVFTVDNRQIKSEPASKEFNFASSRQLESVLLLSDEESKATDLSLMSGKELSDFGAKNTVSAHSYFLAGFATVCKIADP